MSANLTWKLPRTGKSLNAGSSDRSALREAFGDFPIHLREGDRRTLLAMAAVPAISTGPYKKIADLLLKHEEVILDEEW